MRRVVQFLTITGADVAGPLGVQTMSINRRRTIPQRGPVKMQATDPPCRKTGTERKDPTWRLVLLLSGCIAAAATPACDRRHQRREPESGNATPAILQTDWYAQPEHGGFYQALAQGYFREAGLAVEILPGGPNAMVAQKVAQGRVQFGLGRSDDVIVQVSRGIPLVMVGAFMEHDPQALMVHAQSAVLTFSDLEGKTVMATPGLAWIEYVKRRFEVNFSVVPHDFGLQRFLNDPEFIQQVFVTNEPFHVRKHGADTRTLILAESGFDPYRVIYTNRSLALNNPETLEAFVKASLRGWKAYLSGDRAGADAMVMRRNPQMSPELIDYGVASMREHRLVFGDEVSAETHGTLDRERIEQQIRDLSILGMLDSRVTPEQVLWP